MGCYSHFGNQTAPGLAFTVASPTKAMAKYAALMVQEEQLMAPDLLSVFRGPSRPSSHPHDPVFVVNPGGANGQTGKEWKKLLPYVRSLLARIATSVPRLMGWGQQNYHRNRDRTK